MKKPQKWGVKGVLPLDASPLGERWGHPHSCRRDLRDEEEKKEFLQSKKKNELFPVGFGKKSFCNFSVVITYHLWWLKWYFTLINYGLV
jgi:hypothetical protein